MDQAFAMRVFVQVVDEGSFSKAAPRVGITQSSASRYISTLEAELGVQLLQRSTRKLNLTEAGQIYYERSLQIIQDIDEANLAVRRLNAVPSGILRVTAPATFGRSNIAPYLAEFYELYPEITIGLSLSDSVDDVIGAGFDLAIRFGNLKDTSLIARRLASSRSIVCAHPTYLKRNNTPQTPADLADNNCLTFRTTPGANTWHFERDEKTYSIEASGSLYADNGDTLQAAAAAGLGIVQLPSWVVAPEIANGNLVPILQDFDLIPNSTPIHAVFAQKLHLAPKVTVFIEFLKDRYKKHNW